MQVWCLMRLWNKKELKKKKEHVFNVTPHVEPVRLLSVYL